MTIKFPIVSREQANLAVATLLLSTLASEGVEDYSTKEQGAASAVIDFKSDWIDVEEELRDVQSLRQQLIQSVGATSDFLDGYVAQLQVLAS